MGQPSATITLTMREVDRIKTMQALADRMLRPAQAAARLGLTVRQVERLARRYREEGAEGLVSRKRGQPSNHQLAVGVADRAIAIVRERYADFGPTLAAEKLAELHGLKIGVETLRGLMMAAGLWIPRKQRAPKIHQPRNRRSCLGELIQIDGSDHAWFEDRAPACTLLVFIDDATSRLMQLRFVPTESAFAYFETTRAYLEQHGKPVAFYSDKASIFRPVTKPEFCERGVTQFGRALYELNIDMMCANTSQAKGRVERANHTLQDRLVKELRLRGISTREAANAFAPHFIADFNSRFAKPPRRDFDAHRPLRADEDLDLIFTWREQRKVSLSLTLNYAREIYILADTAGNRRLIQRYIDVYEYPDGRIEVRAGGRALSYVRYDRLPQIDTAAVVENKRLGHALAAAQMLQAQRDSRRTTPSRTNQGQAPYPKKALPGTKSARQLTKADLHAAVMAVCQVPEKQRLRA
jgi:transposase